MPSAISIDDYAESMFRFERLHPKWIESCAGYLRHVFGPAIEGKVFLDYAFGRGNWSLAALKAGAGSVIAVDAAESNVRRFSDHCRNEGVSAVKVIHGNIVETPITAGVDILWVYGILPNIADPDLFLDRLAALRRDDDALALLYAYDSGSFRETVVSAARRAWIYPSEQAFVEDSMLFTPAARTRARDDLCAPLVEWYSASELSALAAQQGLLPQRQCRSFADWLGTKPSVEFAPHHLLCGFRGERLRSLKEKRRPGAADFPILASLAEAVIAAASPGQKRKLALGLFNTHFSALRERTGASAAVVEDFLFLMHAALRLGLVSAQIPADARLFYEASEAATRDALRALPVKLLETSPLAQYLATHIVRF